MKKWCQLITTLWLLISTSLPALAEVRLDEGFTHRHLGEGVLFLEDTTGKRTLHDIQSEKNWQVSTQQTFSFGFTESVFWIKTTVVNPMARQRSLLAQVDYPFLDEVRLFIVKQEGIESYLTGDSVPSSVRPMRHVQHLIPFDLEGVQSADLYFRVRSQGTVQIPLDIWTQTAFIEMDHLRSILYGVFFGLLLSISLYHFFLFLSIREKAYLNYSMFYVSLLGAYVSLNGLPSIFFWPNTTNISDRFLIVCVGFAIYFPCMFAYEVLAVKASRPALGIVMKGNGLLGLAMVALAFFLPYILSLKIVLALAISSITINFIVYVVRFLDRYPPAKYMLLSGFFASVGLFITIFVKLGVIGSSFLTENASYIGVSMMALLHAFALSQRINMDKDQLASTQQELLNAKQKTNEDLDHLVRARTFELEQANEKLQRLSTTDALTKLGNRRYFDDLYLQAFHQGYRDQSSVSLLLLDIDHFKHINDTYGHQFGDACLIEAAKHILSCVRRPQDTVARYGGEEFVVLLPNTTLDGAVCIAELIVGRFREAKVFYTGAEIMMTVSIGVVSVIPYAGLNEDHLLSKADKLLYRAKQNGRNRVEWEPPPSQPEESFILDLN